MAVSESADFPLLFRLARAFSTLLDGHRGQFFLYHLLSRLGQLKGAGRFRFFDSHIYIPLDIPETLFIRDFSLFEGLREVNFANAVLHNLSANATFIDCGAAFGQVSCRIARLCPNVGTIVAVEPNPVSCAFVEKNLALIEGKATHLVNAAVSNFRGKGELCFPRGEHDTHSAYIRQSDSGSIEVTRIDDLAPLVHGDVALKLDVEGAELAAIEGAQETIRRADNICFLVEVHPEVLARTGYRAEDMLMAINRIRETTWVLADAPLTRIDPHRPFFDQVEKRIYDVIGISRRA